MNVWSIFWKVLHSHPRYQKTTSNLIKITLKGQIEGQQWTTSRWSYVHTPMIKFWGTPPQKKKKKNSPKNIDGFRQNNSLRLLEVIKFDIKKTQGFFIFYLPKPCFGFNSTTKQLYITSFFLSLHMTFCVVCTLRSALLNLHCSYKLCKPTISLNWHYSVICLMLCELCIQMSPSTLHLQFLRGCNYCHFHCKQHIHIYMCRHLNLKGQISSGS